MIPTLQQFAGVWRRLARKLKARAVELPERDVKDLNLLAQTIKGGSTREMNALMQDLLSRMLKKGS